MADLDPRRNRRSPLVVASSALVALFLIVALPGAAQAAARTVHDKAHDVTVFDPSAKNFFRKAPHVRADDITALAGSYRPHHLRLALHMRGRDRYSSESYSFLIASGHVFYVVAMDVDPLDPRGTVWSQRFSPDTNKPVSGRQLHRLAARVAKAKSHYCPIDHSVGDSSVTVRIPAWCLGRAGSVNVFADADRTKGQVFYDDSTRHTLTVHRD